MSIYFFQLFIIVLGIVPVISTNPDKYGQDGKCYCHILGKPKGELKEETKSGTQEDLLRQRRKTIDELLANFRMDMDNEKESIDRVSDADPSDHWRGRLRNIEYQNLRNGDREIDVIYPKLATNYPGTYLGDSNERSYSELQNDFEKSKGIHGMANEEQRNEEINGAADTKANRCEEDNLKNSGGNKVDKGKESDTFRTEDNGNHRAMDNKSETLNNTKNCVEDKVVDFDASKENDSGNVKPKPQNRNGSGNENDGSSQRNLYKSFEKSENRPNPSSRQRVLHLETLNDSQFVKAKPEEHLRNFYDLGEPIDIEGLNYLSQHHMRLYTITTTERGREAATPQEDSLEAFKYPIGILRESDSNNSTENPTYIYQRNTDLGDQEVPEISLDYDMISKLYKPSNDQVEISKNNLSHEADYKLSKVEQERAGESSGNNSSTSWKWPWSLAKRSASFNAMNEIKLKTSSRLMRKGFGPSLPSYSLGENRRDLMIDNMLKRKEKEFLRADRKYNELESVPGKDELNVMINEDQNLNGFGDLAENSLPKPVDINNWDNVRRKRISNYSKLTERNKEEKYTQGKENKGTQNFDKRKPLNKSNQTLKNTNDKLKRSYRRKRSVNLDSDSSRVRPKSLQNCTENGLISGVSSQMPINSLMDLQNLNRNFPAKWIKFINNGEIANIIVDKPNQQKSLLKKIPEIPTSEMIEGPIKPVKNKTYKKALEQCSALYSNNREVAENSKPSASSKALKSIRLEKTLDGSFKSFEVGKRKLHQTRSLKKEDEEKLNSNNFNTFHPFSMNPAKPNSFVHHIKKRDISYADNLDNREYYRQFKDNNGLDILPLEYSNNPMISNVDLLNSDKERYLYKTEVNHSIDQDKIAKTLKAQQFHKIGDKSQRQNNHRNFKDDHPKIKRPSNGQYRNSKQNSKSVAQVSSSSIPKDFLSKFESSWLKRNSEQQKSNSKPKAKINSQEMIKVYGTDKKKFASNVNSNKSPNRSGHNSEQNSSKMSGIKHNNFSYENNLSKFQTNPSNWPTHLYDQYPNMRSWLEAIEDGNKSLQGDSTSTAIVPSVSDDSKKIALEFRNEILNCTAYSSLEDFLKALPNTTTNTIIEGEPEEIEIDFTTVEIPNFSMENFNSSSTEFPVTPETDTKFNPSEALTESQPITEWPTENISTTECNQTNENWSTSSDSTEEDYGNPPTQITDYDESITKPSSGDDSSSSSTTEYSFIDRPESSDDDVKLNININANVQGNSRNNSFFGNGTFHVKPGYLDDRFRRDIFESSQKPESMPINLKKDNDTIDLAPGQLSSNIVKSVFRYVRENPKLKVLWPSLKRNTLPQKPQMPNFYAIRNKDNEKQIQQSEQMMKQALNALNDIVEQQVHSSSCLQLRPDLREFYNLIQQTNHEQMKYREKRQNDNEKFHSENSKNSLNFSNTEDAHNVEDEYGSVKKLLREYDELSNEDQESASGVNNKLLSELSELRKLKDNEAKQRHERIQRKYLGKEHNELEILEEYYTPEFSKLQKACTLFREKDNE